MISDTRYQIDTLLKMAKITGNENSRNKYVELAEELLFSDGNNSSYEITIFPYGIREFLQNFDAHKKTCAETYNSYLKFCETNGYEKVTKCKFGREIRKFGYIMKSKRNPINQDVQGYYFFIGEENIYG